MTAATAWQSRSEAGAAQAPPLRGSDPVRHRRPGGRRHLVLVPSDPRAARPGRLHLTAAGRVVLLGLALLAAFVAALVILSVSGGAPAVDHTVTVEPGQTLSEIAATELPELSVAEGVAQIQIANELRSSQVSAGEVLDIPAF